ncbi:unnamed protein product [Lepidochelys kempii]
MVSRLHELQPVCFQTAPRKHLYTLVLHTLHALTLVSHSDTKWRDVLPPLEGEQPRWASLYSTLVLRPVGDMSLRLLHGAVTMGTYLARFNPIPETCPFCGVRETLAHVYLECARLQPLFQLLTNLSLRFWLHFSPHLFIYALPIRGLTKSRDHLVNLLLALAKMAIYKTRERRLEFPVTVGPFSDPRSVHVSRRSSSGQRQPTPLMLLRSGGCCLGSLLSVPFVLTL